MGPLPRTPWGGGSKLRPTPTAWVGPDGTPPSHPVGRWLEAQADSDSVGGARWDPSLAPRGAVARSSGRLRQRGWGPMGPLPRTPWGGGSKLRPTPTAWVGPDG